MGKGSSKQRDVIEYETTTDEVLRGLAEGPAGVDRVRVGRGRCCSEVAERLEMRPSNLSGSRKLARLVSSCCCLDAVERH